MKNILKMGYKALALSIFLTLSTTLSAQETASLLDQEGTRRSPKDSFSATIGVDLVDQYIWRGQDLGNVGLQPTLGISYKGLSLSTWGHIGISNWADPKELDFTLSYTYKGFSVVLTDYWFSQGNYFQYKNGKTTHIWEAGIGYDFDFLSIKWFTNFAGNDGVNGSGNRAYSSYFELTAPFRLATLDWAATVGCSPWRTTSYGNTHFAVTDITLKATKDFLLKKKYHLPVFAGLTANPDSKKVYLLFGVGFNFEAKR